MNTFEQNIEIVKNNLIKNKVNFFCIEEKRDNKKVLIDGKRVYPPNSYYNNRKMHRRRALPKTIKNPKEHDRKTSKLIGIVKNQAFNFLMQNNFQIRREKPIFTSKWKNEKTIKSLNTYDEFYYIDIKHCYWRIAYIKGYISKKIYKEYANDKEMKQSRNVALACIVAPKKRTYYVDGKEAYSITEDNEAMKTMYNNIRYFNTNALGKLAEEIGDSCLSYYTDSILVTKDCIEHVKNYFKNKRLLIRIKTAQKFSDSEYILVDEIKKF